LEQFHNFIKNLQLSTKSRVATRPESFFCDQNLSSPSLSAPAQGRVKGAWANLDPAFFGMRAKESKKDSFIMKFE